MLGLGHFFLHDGPETSFKPFGPPLDVADAARDYRIAHRPRLLERASAGIVRTLHKS